MGPKKAETRNPTIGNTLRSVVASCIMTEDEEHHIREREPNEDEEAGQTAGLLAPESSPVKPAWARYKRAHGKRLIAAVLAALAALSIIAAGVNFSYLSKEIQNVPQLSMEAKLAAIDDEGVKVRLFGDMLMDYDTAVAGTLRRSFAKTAAALAGRVTIEAHDVQIFKVPEGVELREEPKLFAKVRLRPIDVDVVDGHTTHVDTLATVYEFGDSATVGGVLDAVVAGNGTRLRAASRARIRLWGITFPIAMAFERAIAGPGSPGNGSRLVDGELISMAMETDASTGDLSVRATAKLQLTPPPGIDFDATIPATSWNVALPGCSDGRGSVEVCSATIEIFPLKLGRTTTVTATALIHKLPKNVTEPCSDDEPSPLDNALRGYLDGQKTELQIKGSESQPTESPQFLHKLLPGISAALSLPPRRGDSMQLLERLELRNFDLEYGSPVLASAEVRAYARVPSFVHIDDDVLVQIPAARGIADLYYQGHYFARAAVDDWVPCVTHKDPDSEGVYIVDFALDGVPVEVVDQAVLRQIVAKLVVSPCVPIEVAGLVDGSVSTPVGDFDLTRVPVAGDTEFCRNKILPWM